jgi:hypothetical protein
MNSDDPPDKRVMYRERFQGVYLTLMRTDTYLPESVPECAVGDAPAIQRKSSGS